MTMEQLMAELGRRDVVLYTDSGKLKVNAPKGALTSELKQAIGEHNALVGLAIVIQQWATNCYMAPLLWAKPLTRMHGRPAE